MFSQVVLTKFTFVLDIVKKKDINLSNLHDVHGIQQKRKRAERMDFLGRVSTCQIIST